MNTRRRWLTTGAAWSAGFWAGALRAQTNPPVIIGWLETTSREGGSWGPKADPFAAGLVTNLARPGGLITGVSNVSSETRQKVIELLVEAMPKLRRVGLLVDSTTPNPGATFIGARQVEERIRLEPVIVTMAKPEDIGPAFVQLAMAKVQALVIMPSTWFNGHMTLTPRWASWFRHR